MLPAEARLAQRVSAASSGACRLETTATPCQRQAFHLRFTTARLDPSRVCIISHNDAVAVEHPVSRRQSLLFGAAVTTLFLPQPCRADQFDQGLVDDFEATAYQAYADRDFEATVQLLNELIANNPSAPQMPRWLEMRAQVLLDGKNFGAAVTDYNAAIQQSADLDKAVRARLIAGRALAHEGDADWASALADYDQAITLAAEAGQMPDPYVLNSRGNAHASLGQWAEARADYLQSATVFQKAKGFRGRQGSTTMRLDGAVFAASNAAIMLAQLGDEAGALQEMRKIARRAPGSADMRAALAALYWAQGDRAAAEGEWQYACDRVSVGCSKYMDRDWLSRIRRWPPRMVERMQDFLAIRQAGTS